LEQFLGIFLIIFQEKDESWTPAVDVTTLTGSPDPVRVNKDYSNISYF
jgi:hypothetical protein